VLDKPDFDKFHQEALQKSSKKSIGTGKYISLYGAANFSKCQKTFRVLKGTMLRTLRGGLFDPLLTLFFVSD
jgi:hypothetical protein